MKLTYDNSTISDKDLTKYKKKVFDAHKKLCEKMDWEMTSLDGLMLELTRKR